MRKAILLGSVLGILVAIGAFIARPVFATQSSHHNEWGEWQYEFGQCVPNASCGTDEGVQTVTKTRTCVSTNGRGENECQLAHCPGGSFELNNKCYKWENYHLVQVDKLPADTQTVVEEQKCETETPVCEPEVVPGCTDGGATNFNPNANQDDGSCIPVDRGTHEASAPALPACNKIVYAPTVLGYKRLSPTDVKVWWSKVDDFVHKYLVEFGTSANNLPWNEFVEGNETTLHLLPANQPLFVHVAGTHESCIGGFGEIVDP